MGEWWALGLEGQGKERIMQTREEGLREEKNIGDKEIRRKLGTDTKVTHILICGVEGREDGNR